MTNKKVFLFVVAWVDKTTKQVVDAALYNQELPASKDPNLSAAILGLIDGEPNEIADMVAEDSLQSHPHFSWIADMPTIKWQLSWQACQDVPCYASPTPPNPAISPKILGV